jgi:hypothetical protein
VLVVKLRNLNTWRNNAEGLSVTNVSPNLKLNVVARRGSGNKMRKYVADHLSHSHPRH